MNIRLLLLLFLSLPAYGAMDFNLDLLTDDNGLITDEPVSFHCQARPDADVSGDQMMTISVSAPSGVTDQHFIWTVGTGDDLRIESCTSVPTCSNAGINDQLNSGAWNSLGASVLSDSQRDLYINGNTASNTDSQTIGTLSRITIGAAWQGSGARFWDGPLAECAVWSAELTAEQFAMLEFVAPSMVAPESLVAYLPLLVDERELINGGIWTGSGTPTVFPHPPMYYPVRTQFIQFPGGAAGSSDWWWYLQ